MGGKRGGRGCRKPRSRFIWVQKKATSSLFYIEMKRRKWSIYLSIWGYKESTLFRDTLPRSSSRQTKHHHHHQLRTIRSMLRFRGPLKLISLIIQSISRLIIPNVFSITCGRCEFSV